MCLWACLSLLRRCPTRPPLVIKSIRKCRVNPRPTRHKVIHRTHLMSIFLTQMHTQLWQRPVLFLIPCFRRFLICWQHRSRNIRTIICLILQFHISRKSHPQYQWIFQCSLLRISLHSVIHRNSLHTYTSLYHLPNCKHTLWTYMRHLVLLNANQIILTMKVIPGRLLIIRCRRGKPVLALLNLPTSSDGEVKIVQSRRRPLTHQARVVAEVQTGNLMAYSPEKTDNLSHSSST